MNARIYSELARMALQGSGQFIPANHISLIEARLSALMLREGYDDVSTLLQSLPLRATSTLKNEIISEMCSGETHFFRDVESLQILVGNILPRVLHESGNGRARIWCAGVSTGQEAFSLSMLICDTQTLNGADIDILATDISTSRLRRAKRGHFDHFEAQRGLPIRHLMAYFDAQKDKTWAIKPELIDRIRFRQHNLLEPEHDLGQFDIILCQNVFKTMAPDAQRKAVETLIQKLRPNGTLIIGKQESLQCINNAVIPSLTGKNIYELASDSSAIVAA